MKSRTDELPTSQVEKNIPEFLRPPLSRPFSFLTSKLPPYLEKQLKEETERELKLLYEGLARDKRRPSGSDTHLVRKRILGKYQEINLQNGLKSELWQYSERILNLLRTPGLCPAPDNVAVNKALMAFVDKLAGKYFPEVDPHSMFYLGPARCVDLKPTYYLGPNEYFVQTQPELVMDFGHAFFTSISPPPSRPGTQIEPVLEKVLSINTIFWASFVGGDKRLGHDVVYYLPESRFYFFDPVMDCYVPTTEAKLRLSLSLVIQRQACGLLVEQASIILNKCLTEGVLDHIMARAKTLLAMERGFFEGPNSKVRFTQDKQIADEIASTVRDFIENKIDVDETSVLTITECLEALNSYHQKKGLQVPRFKEIKLIVQSKIRELHGRGLRNDLVLPDNRCVAGWKGLRLEKESDIRDYGKSVESATL